MPTTNLSCDSGAFSRVDPDEYRFLLEQGRDAGHYCPVCNSVVSSQAPRCRRCSTGCPTQSWPSLTEHSDPWLGQTIAERYLVTGILGAGMSGSVYRVESLSIPRQFALKIIAVENSQFNTEAVLTRLDREIEALSRLRNPHIVRFYDVFDLQRQYVAAVMDLVEGQTLQALVCDRGAMELTRACTLLRQAANGVSEAHSGGMIHRDLKPDNLMVERLPAGDDFVHILDFGLVRLDDHSDSDVTTEFAGTPLYASPEQALGNSMDHRSDIYSLGAIFYFMLTGRPPFRGSTVYQVLQKHVRDAPPAIDEVAPHPVPPLLRDLIRRMLAKTPQERPDTLSAVIETLDAFLQRHLSEPRITAPQPRSQGPIKTPASGIISVPQRSGCGERPADDSSSNQRKAGADTTNPGWAANPGHLNSLRESSATIEIALADESTGGNTAPGTPGRKAGADSVDSSCAGDIPAVDTVPNLMVTEIIDSTVALLSPAHGSLYVCPVQSLDSRRQLDIDAPAPVRSVALSAQQLFTGHDDGTVYRVCIDTAAHQQIFAADDDTAITAITTDRRGNSLIAGCDDGTALFGPAEPGQDDQWRRCFGTAAVDAVATDSDASMIARARRGVAIEVAYTGSPDELLCAIPLTDPVRALSMSPDGYLLAVTFADSSVAVFRLPDGRRVMSLSDPGVDILRVTFSAGANTAAICHSDAQITLLDFDQLPGR